MEQKMIIARMDKYTPPITWVTAVFKTPAEFGYAIKIIEEALKIYATDVSYEHRPVAEIIKEVE